MRKIKQMLATTLLVMFIASCASQERGVLQLDANYEEVFFASVQAIHEINYAVVNANIDTGFIAAELGSFTSSKTIVNMSVIVKRNPAGTEVEVAIVPRPGAFEIGRGTKDDFRDFTAALKRKFPNLKVN